MKKLLTILLALALLGGCGLAEGMRLNLTDVAVYGNGAPIDPPTGFAAELDAATIGELDSGVRLYCRANGRGLMNLTIGTADGDTVLGYGEGDEFERCYILPLSLPLHDWISGIDLTRQGNWLLIEALRGIIPADCQTDGGTARYRDEVCETTRFELDESYMDSLLRLISLVTAFEPHLQGLIEGAGFGSLAEAIEAADLHMSLSGVLYEGANTDALRLNVDLSAEREPVEVELRVEHEPIGQGHRFDLAAKVSGGDIAMEASAKLEAVMDAEADWLPIDTEGARELESADLDSGFFQNIFDSLM